MGFAESAWAQPRAWEAIENPEERKESIEEGWNVFANTLGQRELPRLSYLNGGYNYRVPPPGAIVRDGMLYANTAFPGLTLRYTTDGARAGDSALVYKGPMKIPGPTTLRAFDHSGKSSRPVRINPFPSRLRND